MIQDRNARVENRKRIITEDSLTEQETYGRPATGGVPEQWGEPRPTQGHEGRTGVAFPMPGAGDDVPDLSPKICTAITKAGNACQAHPIRGEELCIGHSRV